MPNHRLRFIALFLVVEHPIVIVHANHYQDFPTPKQETITLKEIVTKFSEYKKDNCDYIPRLPTHALVTEEASLLRLERNSWEISQYAPFCLTPMAENYDGNPPTPKARSDHVNPSCGLFLFDSNDTKEYM